jgi:hypothetical protein
MKWFAIIVIAFAIITLIVAYLDRRDRKQK